jgi:hypothetical protein
MTQVETYAPNAEGEPLQMIAISATTSPTGMPVPGHQRVQFIPHGQAWNWASQRFENVPEKNPCLGVSLNAEKASQSLRR